MSARTDGDSDDQWELRRAANMLPPPDQLVLHEDTVKVALALSIRSVAFFERVPYRHMIRALIDEHTRRMG